MSPHYRHTQVGWVMLGALVALALVVVVLAPGAHVPRPVYVAMIAVGLVLLLFATLTVEVDRERVRLAFTGGVISKRIALSDVEQLRRVRNAWWYGFGIRLLPGGGRLWNVSGLDAVELALRGGGRFRIGTDEPDALASALEQATSSRPRTDAAPAPAGDVGGRRCGTRLALVLAGLGAFGGLFAAAVVPLQMRPPHVIVTPRQITIDSLFYGETYAMDDVTAVSLDGRLPSILQRSNGFAGGGELRGWFLLEGLGRGKLFVSVGNAPYVLIRTRQSFAVVNFSDPRRTQALYDEIVAARGH